MSWFLVGQIQDLISTLKCSVAFDPIIYSWYNRHTSTESIGWFIVETADNFKIVYNSVSVLTKPLIRGEPGYIFRNKAKANYVVLSRMSVIVRTAIGSCTSLAVGVVNEKSIPGNRNPVKSYLNQFCPMLELFYAFRLSPDRYDGKISSERLVSFRTECILIRKSVSPEWK